MQSAIQLLLYLLQYLFRSIETYNENKMRLLLT